MLLSDLLQFLQDHGVQLFHTLSPTDYMLLLEVRNAGRSYIVEAVLSGGVGGDANLRLQCYENNGPGRVVYTVHNLVFASMDEVYDNEILRECFAKADALLPETDCDTASYDADGGSTDEEDF